jgi:hypothetical protein
VAASAGCAADGPDAALLEQIGRDLVEQGSESTLGLGYLARESLDSLAEPAQDAGEDVGTRPRSSGGPSKSLAGE